jgi:hypothetical protein
MIGRVEPDEAAREQVGADRIDVLGGGMCKDYGRKIEI